VRIVFLGDSLTEGVGGVAYLRLLRERARVDPRLSAVELINAGVGGDTVVNLARRGAQGVVSHDPDWVVIQVGVNDCATWLLRRSPLTPRTIRGRRYFSRIKQVPGAIAPRRHGDGLRVLIADLRAATRARIALCTPSLYGESPQDRSWRLLERYVEVVMQVATERGCPIIDARRGDPDLQAWGGSAAPPFV
jgi:lysophospholipase L1-like esterase